MTKKERIEELERRVSELEVRLAYDRSFPPIIVPVPYPEPYPWHPPFRWVTHTGDPMPQHITITS